MPNGSRNEPFVVQADGSNGLDNTADEPTVAEGGAPAPPDLGGAAEAATDLGASAPAGEEGTPDPGTPEPGTPAEHEHEHDGHRVVEDLEELAAKAERADEYLVLAQRTKADFENYRKRASREAALAQERGVAKLVKELLPAIDNLDRAVQAAERSASDESEPAERAGTESQLVSGIKLVHADVLAALARVGIEPFSPLGEAFDPQYHEAVAQHPIEGAATGTVVEVYQQGYRMGETVLRPARVLVAA